MSLDTPVGRELLGLIERCAMAVPPPPVRRVYVPEPHITADKDAEFGLVELADGAAGLFYAWLGESQRGISERFLTADLAARDALDVARLFAEPDDMSRSIGLAAINAISQSLMGRAGFVPPAARDSLGGRPLQPGDHLGLVGYFPSIVRHARARGIAVTVIERKHHLLREEDGIAIVTDPARLADCNAIICTAATLINDSIDDVVSWCRHAAHVALIGPSASFLPDPLFKRGFAAVGGTRVIDAAAAVRSQQDGAGLRGSGERYVLTRADYPGVDALVERAR